MCDTCGCNITSGNVHLLRKFDLAPNNKKGLTAITVLKSLLSANDQQARHNRLHFDLEGILVINLMSSPGSGKTSLLEKTIEALKKEVNIAVIEGDLETENDAKRIRAKGVPAVQITTGNACHLDAHLVHNALHQLDLEGLDIIFIENVGNLVCPASFDLGQHHNITLLSVTEGDDKPAKYPVMFRAADVVLITKIDLLPYLDDFEPNNVITAVHELANDVPIWSLSNRDLSSLDPWLNWLRDELQVQRQRLLQQQTKHPKIQPDGIALHSHHHHE